MVEAGHGGDVDEFVQHLAEGIVSGILVQGLSWTAAYLPGIITATCYLADVKFIPALADIIKTVAGLGRHWHARSFDFISFLVGVLIVGAVLMAAALAARHGWSRRDRRKRLAYLLLKLSSLDEEGARSLFGDVCRLLGSSLGVFLCVWNSAFDFIAPLILDSVCVK